MKALIVVLTFAGATLALAQAAVPEGWFEFALRNTDIPQGIVNVAALNARPAGATGFLRVKDGHFVEGDGTPIRFVGTDLCFAYAFPTHEAAELLARRMRAYGINVVRFHHMDSHFRPRGIWDPEYKDKRHPDAEQLDRLDYVIYQLKQNGIYANLNLHVSRKFTEEHNGFPQAALLPKYDKGVDNFEPRMIELQKEYARQLLTHVNGYTKQPYVSEPALAFVEFSNEDSMLQYAFGSTLHNLPPYYRDQLQALFDSWLKEKYGDTKRLAAAWDEGSEPVGEEMLANTDFARDQEGWSFEMGAPGEGTMTVVEEGGQRALQAEMTKLGNTSWTMQVHQKGLTLQDGKAYTLSFEARAEPPRTVTAGARYDIAPWTTVGLSEPTKLTPKWQSFTYTFRAKQPPPEHTRISFNAGNMLGKVWIRKVSLRPGGILGLPAGQKLEDGTVDLPQSSATRQARMDWLDFVAATERKYVQTMREYVKQELKLHALVVDTQATYGGLGGVYREAQNDYIDAHAYWQHPHFPGRPWDSGNWFIGNSSMILRPGGDTLGRLAQHRVAGMAFTVSEYNHPAPSDYRAECDPMVFSFAGLQDWDAVYLFAYGGTDVEQPSDRINGYFNINTDVTKMALLPIAANLFRRGDVRPARQAVRLTVPPEQLPALLCDFGRSTSQVWAAAGVGANADKVHRTEIEFVPGGKLKASAKLEPEGVLQSDTKQIRWDATDEQKATYLVNTEKTVVACGFLGGQKIELGPVTIEMAPSDNNFAVIGLSAMDDRPLASSEKILVAAVGKVENQEMGWNEERTTVLRKWGHGPTICEGIRATVALRNDRGLRVFALDPLGERTGEVGPADRFEIGPRYKTVWYECAAR